MPGGLTADDVGLLSSRLVATAAFLNFASMLPIEQLISNEKDIDLKRIAEKIIANKRITEEEGLILFEKGDLPYLGMLANYKREQLHGDRTYFNRNFHIEPTNVCVYACKFCSYSRLYAHRDEGWELSMQQMLDIVIKYDGQPVTRGTHRWWCSSKNEPGILCRIIKKNKNSPA